MKPLPLLLALHSPVQSELNVYDCGELTSMNVIAFLPYAQLGALLDRTHRNDKPNSTSICQLDALLKKEVVSFLHG